MRAITKKIIRAVKLEDRKTKKSVQRHNLPIKTSNRREDMTREKN